ncbi:sigma 54-interacting transcriptional regulator [Undibacterium terreum]|uniref:sigma 54-interacting transcriptional regulator n=1 Tax=Undibacterium terreum TaxID=1224302 RepID=UPI001668FA0E|nr:sigma 54-interacting transcriptional regulator [Undibacterium terreum]
MSDNTEYTLTSRLPALQRNSGPMLGLTILWHPEMDRVGEQFMGPAGEGVVELSRSFPFFHQPGKGGVALGHRCIARAPLTIRRNALDTVEIIAAESLMEVEVNGSPLVSSLSLSREEVDKGVVLALGGVVLVCIHWMRNAPKANGMDGLLGVSSAAITMRDQIRQVAQTDLTVLLLGETGTGKEVAARAVHASSKCKDGPMVAVNMAALNESLAAADLFGAVKGAYTGAQNSRAGLFAEADGGTLFLDEIGDTPVTVQPMLLRVLETGDYRPLGARADQRSSARLIAATDQDLDARAFNQALLRRLEAFVIHVPALRERREDIGLLIAHFLRQWTAQTGVQVELPMPFISEMCNDDWPGNIRQLAQVLRRAVMVASAGDVPVLADFVRSHKVSSAHRTASSAQRSMSREGSAEPVHAATAKAISPASNEPVADLASLIPAEEAVRKPRLSELTHEDILSAMESNAWRISNAAQQLGISRPTMYKLLENHPQIRWAEAIPQDEIRQALQDHAGDLDRCASTLKTPSEALRRQLRVLRLINN